MSQPSEPPDNIEDRTSEGDFMRLLMQHEPALRAFARTLLPEWGLVDEVIQEASVTLWQKFDQLRSMEGFLPWAKVTVRFKCLSVIGALRRDRHVFSEGVIKMLADEAESIDAGTQASAMKALRGCLAKFSDSHQELLLAPYASDGGVKMLASQVGKSPNALYKLLGRLREKLAVCIHSNLAQDAR